MTTDLDRVLLEIRDLRLDLVAQIKELQRQLDVADQEQELLVEAVRRTAYDLSCDTRVSGVSDAVEALVEMAKTCARREP
jgi:hypothetical protein